MRTDIHPAAPEQRLNQAQRKTTQVRDQLKVAGGELHLTKSVIEQELPAASDDVAHALAQQDVIEEKVMEAADELATVRGLLDEEVAERQRIEQELTRARQQGEGERG